MSNANNATVAEVENTAIETETVGAPSLLSETTNPVAESVEVNRTNASEARESIKTLPFGIIRCDRERNPRKLRAYSSENLNTLARSILKYGLQDAIVVSKRADGSHWTVKGHRRHAAIELIHNGIPAIVNAKGKELEAAIPANPEFLRSVKCRVLTGMTYQDELDMLMDHAEVVGLDPQEKYLTAEILTRNGFTHEFIASKLGISRSNYSNFLGRLVVMPAFVAEAFMADPDREDSPKAPTQELLKKLYPVYQKEQRLPGARIKEAGPEFLRAWEEFQGGVKATTPKMIPRSQLETQAGTVKDAGIRDVLQAILQNAPMDLSTAITRLEMRLGDVN